jgi:hypothetical protein
MNYAFIPIVIPWIRWGSYYSNQRSTTAVPNGGILSASLKKNSVLLQVNRKLLQFSGVVIVSSQPTVFQGVLWLTGNIYQIAVKVPCIFMSYDITC